MEREYQWPQCDHEEQETRKRHVAGGKPRWVLQCMTCGAQIRAVKHDMVSIHQVMNPIWFDEGLSERWREQCKRQYEDWKNQKNGVWWESYNQYLTTPEWRSRRKQVIDRAQGICEGCRRQTATQVHHLSYEHWGNELLFELVAVCDVCHKIIHMSRKEAA